ncbi:MAG: hypothetical protein U0326_27945 [Polyangiales bacterium]
MVSAWRVLPPVRCRWTDADPADPDFEVEFEARVDDEIEVRPTFPLGLAQRVFRKPPGVRLTREGETLRVAVMVGLTAVYRVAGRRADALLSSMVRVRARRAVALDDALVVVSEGAVRVRLPRG